MKVETIVLGGGCFWCLEAAYLLVNGITSVTSGYAGGHHPNPNYETVSTGNTGHAEVVRLEFDPSIISLGKILDIFWTIHDPTSIDRQGNDMGPQYRSVIIYTNPSQQDIIDTSIAKANTLWNDRVVTKVQPLETFYKAEDYHQNYFANNPEQGYCQVVINPKLTKLRTQHAALLR